MLVDEARAAFKESGDAVFREREQLVVNLLQVHLTRSSHFKESSHPQNRRLFVLLGNSKRQVDNFGRRLAVNLLQVLLWGYNPVYDDRVKTHSHPTWGCIPRVLHMNAVRTIDASLSRVCAVRVHKPQTVNPEPQTLNPKLQDLNPQPQTPTPEHQSLNPKPQISIPKP